MTGSCLIYFSILKVSKEENLMNNEKEITKKLITCLNEGLVEESLTYFAEDAVVEDQPEKKSYFGKEDIREFLKQTFIQLNLYTEIVEEYEHEKRLIIKVKVSGDFPGKIFRGIYKVEFKEKLIQTLIINQE
jgi:hypothetical protein